MLANKIHVKGANKMTKQEAKEQARKKAFKQMMVEMDNKGFLFWNKFGFSDINVFKIMGVMWKIKTVLWLEDGWRGFKYNFKVAFLNHETKL